MKAPKSKLDEIKKLDTTKIYLKDNKEKEKLLEKDEEIKRLREKALKKKTDRQKAG